MKKFSDNGECIEPMDAIIVLNDNYRKQGIEAGYIGEVIENLIPERGIVLADFYDPFTGRNVAVLAEIKKGDFRAVTSSQEDKKAVKAYRDLFRKNF